MDAVIAKKNLVTICMAGGMMIFGGVLLAKVEVWTEQQKAAVAQQTAEEGWQVFLYQQTARDVLARNQDN